MKYELYYWPSIPGRGEFVRLALEDAGTEYIDVGRESGARRIAQFMEDAELATPPFAPPFLKAGKLLIAQVANILFYLGARHDLAPGDEAGSLWVHQLQLTLADWVVEIHDTHHPLGPSLYYEEQKEEARKRTGDFLASRLPKFLGYFERVLERNVDNGRWLAGKGCTYADLSLFQVINGLRYAFPRRMHSLMADYPRIEAVVEAVTDRPRIASYLSSTRRLPFNEDGIFRHYPELDA
jgi:glutathione S-transferase